MRNGFCHSKSMEAVGSIALKLALEEKSADGPFGFNKKKENDEESDT